jgi:hypothetical protein
MTIRREDFVSALSKLAGTSRLLVYDVSEADAPERSSPSTPFVRGSEAWWRFVDRRRALDDGQGLNLLVSLRGLRPDERMLVVNWGTSFANAFLMIEPSDPWLDLTTPEGLQEFADKTGAADATALVRAAYAEWIYWVHDEDGRLERRDASLSLDENETLWQGMAERLPSTFPESAFLSSLTMLTLRESELFTGGRQVGRAVIPFLTRLGLPVLYDGWVVVRGVRELVNAGLARVQDPQDHWRSYRGPIDPIPPNISDERVALMMR